MNNKGFAISGILYSVLLLFLMVLLSLLYVLVTRINRLTTLVEEVQTDIETKNVVAIAAEEQPSVDKPYFITTVRGKYEIKINGTNTCHAYLPKDIVLKVSDSKLKYILPDENNEIDAYATEGFVDLSFIDCNNTGVTSFTVDNIYTSIGE